MKYFKKRSTLMLMLMLLLFIFFIIIHRINNLELFKKKKTNFKIVLFFTSGLCDEAKNLIFSMKKNNISHLLDNLFIIALDKKAYKCIKNLNLNIDVRLNKKNVISDASFGNEKFFSIVYNKFEVIEKALKKSEIVVYSDTDIVYLKDISDDVEDFRKSDYDVLFQDDEGNMEKKSDYLCSGFIFFKSIK